MRWHPLHRAGKTIRGPRPLDTRGHTAALAGPRPAFQGDSLPLLSVSAPAHSLLTGPQAEGEVRQGGRERRERRREGGVEAPCPGQGSRNSLDTHRA